MPQQRWSIITPSDSALIAGFESIMEAVNSEQESFTFALGQSNSLSVNGTVENLRDNPVVQQLRQSDAVVIYSAGLQLPRFFNASVGITRQEGGIGVDLLTCNIPNDVPPAALVQFLEA